MHESGTSDGHKKFQLQRACRLGVGINRRATPDLLEANARRYSEIFRVESENFRLLMGERVGIPIAPATTASAHRLL